MNHSKIKFCLCSYALVIGIRVHLNGKNAVNQNLRIPNQKRAHAQISAVVNKKRKRAGKYEFEYAEASEPARLEGERWVDACEPE